MLQHGVAVNIGKYSPIAVFIQSTRPYINYSLTTNSDSTKNFILNFRETHNVIAKSAIWQAGTIVRYLVQNSVAYSVGDVVKCSQFGTAANNGSFLVTEVDTANNYLYVNNRSRTSAAGDETKVGYSGDTLVKHSVVVGLINA